MSMGLVVGGAEVAERGVPAAGVVEALEVGEDGVGQLLSGGPCVPVEQFGLQGGEEARPGRCRSSRRCCPSIRAGRPRAAAGRTSARSSARSAGVSFATVVHARALKSAT